MLSMREVYDEYNNDNVVVVALFNSSTLNWPDLAEVQVVQWILLLLCVLLLPPSYISSSSLSIMLK